jgi:hypothetical protein
VKHQARATVRGCADDSFWISVVLPKAERAVASRDRDVIDDAAEQGADPLVQPADCG